MNGSRRMQGPTRHGRETVLGAALLQAVVLVALVVTAGWAQETPGGGDPRVGTIVVAHGADEAWNAPVLEIASRALTDGPVEVSFLMGEEVVDYRFQDAVLRLVEKGADRIVVVPLLASSFSGHYDQISYLAGALDELDENMLRMLANMGLERPSVELSVQLTAALDASPEIATILAERALRLAQAPAEQALFIIGHGPNDAQDYAEWMRNLRPIADSVTTLTRFRDVKIGLVRDDAPTPVRAEAVRRIREVIELQSTLTGHEVVVVPLLISRGYVSTHRFPADLDGLTIAYDGEGLLPHPELATWIARRVREAIQP